MEKIVKTRKDHECCACEKIIKKGENANYREAREPTYDLDDNQIGIEYLHLYMHVHDCMKPESCEDGKHSWVDEYCIDPDEEYIDPYPALPLIPTGNKFCENCFDVKPEDPRRG